MKRIGLFGGTFNPVHMGHIKVALGIKEQFRLDEILFIPSALPPHKRLDDIANADVRLEMVRAALANQPGLTASDVEIKRDGPSFTIDTIEHFIKYMPPDTTLFFIVGLDAMLEIKTWRSFDRLFDLISFIVTARPGECSGNRHSQWQELEECLRKDVSRQYHFDPDTLSFTHAEKQTVYISEVTFVNISATDIREKIKNGESLKGLLPESVDDMIKTRGLYL